MRLLGWLPGVPSGSGKYLLIESWEILAGTLVGCLRLKIAFQSVVARNPDQLIDLTAQWMEHMRPRRDVPFELLTQLAELQKIGFYVLQQEATALEHHESFKTILPQGADALTTARVMRALPRSLDPMRSPHGAVTCYPAPPGF